MKILVTGATGFIGSHLVELLVKSGFEVIAFDRYNSNNHWGWLEDSIYKNEIEIILGDIRDYDSVFKSMQGCDAVFHLAALIGIPYSYVSPLAYVRTNVEGTYNVLEASRQLGLGNVLITSTSEIYGTAQYVPIDENHPMLGQSPYSATKISADQLAVSYHYSFNMPIKIVRPFNTYGPRQSARAVIPTIVGQILTGKEEIQLGNLTPTRDLTYVKDTCMGFLEIYHSDHLYGEVTNIGMNEESSIGDIARLIIQLMGAHIQIQTDENRLRPEKSEVQRLKCDNTKILRETNWKPEYNLKSGLQQTISWFEENKSFLKLERYNI